MVRFTVDVIQGAAQYINPIKERELDLRGYRANEIENLGATLDQFDTIDFSDNEIRKLDGFPYLKRIKSLLINNNRVSRIAEDLQEQLPSLESIILTNNNLHNLGDLDALSSVKSLRYLSVLKNPVALRKHYRLYIIHKLPQLRVLDFKRVKLAEREEAKKMFKGKKGETLAKELGVKSAPEKKSNTFVPGGEPVAKESVRTADEQLAIKEAISKATTIEEVERLSQLLKSGQLPREFSSRKSSNGHEEEDTQQMDTENDMETET